MTTPIGWLGYLEFHGEENPVIAPFSEEDWQKLQEQRGDPVVSDMFREQDVRIAIEQARNKDSGKSTLIFAGASILQAQDCIRSVWGICRDIHIEGVHIEVTHTIENLLDRNLDDIRSAVVTITVTDVELTSAT